LVPGPDIAIQDLPRLSMDAANEDWTEALRRWTRSRLSEQPAGLMAEAAEQLERCLIEEALKATGGRRAEAARLLGIGRNTLSRKA